MNKLYHPFLAIAATILLCLSTQSAQGQCTFFCNDTINVSVDFNCMADITFDVILEGADSVLNCEYAILLTDENGNTISGATVGKPFVGQLLKAKVFENGNPNGPSCWGYVKIEDKLPPPLECAGNDTLMCQVADPYFTDAMAETTLEGKIQVIINMTDNCGDEDIEVVVTNNVLDRTYCTEGFSAIRYLSYSIFDNSRNVLQCKDTILYEQLLLDTLDAPKNFKDIECTSVTYPSIEYLIGLDSETLGNNSLPNFQGKNIFDYIDSSFVERGLCNLKTTYDDIVFPTCGTTFKVVRRWLVLDWCIGATREFHQIIKVKDTNVNMGFCQNLSGFVADPQTCTALVELTPPSVATNECSDWTFTVEIKEPGDTVFVAFGGSRNMNASVIRRNFALGISEVRYVVTDACGNVDTCTFTVEVKDEEPPIAVCDARTVVTLNDSFLGKAFAKSFDDGSFDHCTGIMSYQVRRIDRALETCVPDVDFADFVKFCCADIGKSILVEMQVTDSTGLTSSCIAEAVVQYKGPGPVIICATSLGIQDCRNFDNFEITSLVAPTVTSANPCIADNLTPLIRETDRLLDLCGDGYIDVEWYINLTGAEEVVCTERIVFENTMPFTASQITWPTDRTVNTCGDVPPTQSELDNLLPDNLQCANVLPSETTDRILEGVGNECNRIRRTWTVVDWCRFPADPSAKYTFVQTIIIVNTTAPQINTSASAVSVLDDADNCRAVVSATGIASDDCSEISQLIWTYEIKSGDGMSTIVPVTTARSFELVLGMGSYQVTWIAMDDCGNSSTITENFIIADNQPPTMRCGSIQKTIDATTKEVVITINDIDNGSFDNCDFVIDLVMRRAGTTDPYTDIIIFNCQEQGVTQVEIRGTDLSGNEASCIAAVDIRDFEDNCSLGSSALEVAGFIYTSQGVAVENVSVRLDASDQSEPGKIITTDVEGSYLFEDVTDQKKYELSAHKVDDYRNGISTLDIILMQQHILGLKRLDEPYKYLAADVNGNRTISATDIVLMRRLLLGHIEVFPGQPAWKFVDRDEYINDMASPWDISDKVEISIQATENGLLGIKMGDLDFNAVANSGLAKGRSITPYTMIAKTRVKKETLSIEIKASSAIDARGLQLGIDFDPSLVSFKGMTAAAIDIKEDHTSVIDGQLRLIWTSEASQYLEEGMGLITLHFDKLSNNNEVNFATSAVFMSEIYDENFESKRVQMVQVADYSNEIMLHQNRPNPFSDVTVIEFELPSQEHIDFSIFDINGAQVFDLSKIFVSGLNQVRISKEGLGLNKGIYYYQIKARERSLTKKMIIL